MSSTLDTAVLLHFFWPFLFCSNKFANKKVKLEELIKKSQDDFKEHEKRAVKAEVQTKKKPETLLLQSGSFALMDGEDD